MSRKKYILMVSRPPQCLGFIGNVSYKSATFGLVPLKCCAKSYQSEESAMKDMDFLALQMQSLGYTLVIVAR